jgi:MFS family permease
VSPTSRLAVALQERGIFYGWVVVGICFLVLCINFGVRLSFGIFFEAFTRDSTLGWTRADTAGVFSLSVLTQAFTSGLIGWMLDRFGARAVYSVGLLVLGSGLIWTSRITSLFELYLAFGFVTGLGTAILGLTVHGTTVSRWFERGGARGLAIGLAYAGTGIGIFVLAPVIERVITISDWRNAYLLLAALALGGVLPITVLLLRGTPGLLGLRAAGAPPQRSGDDPPTVRRDWSFAAALRTPVFWLLMTAGFLSLFTLRMVTVHQVAHFVDRGVPRLTAAAAFGGAGLITALAYIGFGTLSDRIGRERAFYLGAAAQLIALGMLLGLPTNASLFYIYGYALLWGIGEGSRSGLLTAITSDYFAGTNLGSIVGTLGAFFGLGAAAGSWAGGLIYDAQGSYAPALISAALATILACGCVALTKKPVPPRAA